jgi:hypothetical protein
MTKDDVLAAFSIAWKCFETRGINPNEKRFLAKAFETLDTEDFETRTYIVNVYSGLFNYVME